MDLPVNPAQDECTEQAWEATPALTMTGKMMAATVDLRIQSTARQRICTSVKRWTRRRGTCRRKAWSGWCLAGIRKSLQRSQNWQGQLEAQPGSGDRGGPAGGLGWRGRGAAVGSPWSVLKDALEGDWRYRRTYREILGEGA